MVAVAALPERVDLLIYQGDDFALTLTVTNPDGTAADLSTATAEAQVRQSPTSSPPPPTPGSVPANPPDATFECSISSNVVTLTLPGSQTSTLTGAYVWDCHLDYSSGQTVTIAAGKVTATAEVTV